MTSPNTLIALINSGSHKVDRPRAKRVKLIPAIVRHA